MKSERTVLALGGEQQPKPVQPLLMFLRNYSEQGEYVASKHSMKLGASDMQEISTANAPTSTTEVLYPYFG